MDNTAYELAQMLQAQRGSDPMQYGVSNSYVPPPPAQMFSQGVEAMHDPRLSMLPMFAGWRVMGMLPRLNEKLLPAMERQIQRRVELGHLERGQPYVQSNFELGKQMGEAKYPQHEGEPPEWLLKQWKPQ